MAEMDNKYESDELEIDLFDILRDVLRDWWLILIVGVAAAMCSYIIVNLTYQPEYTSRATFVVTSKGTINTYINLDTAHMVATSLTKIFDSEVLKKKVAMDIGTSRKPGTILAEVILETNLFILKVSAYSPNLAFRTITSVMENYTLVTSHIFGNAIIDVLEAPKLPTYPDNYKDTEKVMKLTFAIGSAAMTGLLGVFSVLRDNIKNEQQVAKKLDSRLFGIVYHERKYKTLRSWLRRRKKSVLISNPTASFSFVESFRKMRTKLEYKASKEGYEVLFITSTIENEGKSTVAVNLATVLAQKAKNVLFIDADLRKPSVHKILQIDMEDEMEPANLFEDEELFNNAITFDNETGLYVLFGSKIFKSSTDLVKSDAFADFLKKARERMGYIIINAPPLSVSADAAVLSDLADATLLVVRQSMALTKDINDTIDILSESKSKLIGCVFNNVYKNLFFNAKTYGYHKYFGSYYWKPEKDI